MNGGLELNHLLRKSKSPLAKLFMALVLFVPRPGSNYKKGSAVLIKFSFLSTSTPLKLFGSFSSGLFARKFRFWRSALLPIASVPSSDARTQKR